MKGYCGLSVLLLALLGSPVHAACDKGVALRLAKAFWNEHKDFYYADPAPLKALLTPDFFAVLSSEAACNADGEVCAIDADPWINAQDGEVSEPVSFTLANQQEQGVTVRMQYLFALSDTQKEPQTVSLHFQKSGDNRCYLMDDFIPPATVPSSSACTNGRATTPSNRNKKPPPCWRGFCILPGRVRLSAGLATGSLLHGLRLRLFSADLLQLFDPGLPFVVGLFALLLLELFAHGVDLLDQFFHRDVSLHLGEHDK
nr:hypothetical protein [Aeromonas hydrophila]